MKETEMKEILVKQLRLLSRYSYGLIEACYLATLSSAMLDIVKVLKNPIAGQEGSDEEEREEERNELLAEQLKLLSECSFRQKDYSELTELSTAMAEIAEFLKKQRYFL